MKPELPEGITVFERGWLSSNNVLLQGALPTLVDSGYVTHAAQTVALVEAELGDEPLGLLINTHLHSDHCGGNAALQQRFPALRTEIPPGDAAAVTEWDVGALSYEATGQQCPRFDIQGTLRPGERRRLGDRLWDTCAAPGHDPHAVVLFEPESRTLISADALWENGFGVVFPELLGEPSFEEVAATLDMIEALRPEVVIPGHGAVFRNVPSALASSRRRLEGLAADPARHGRHAFKVLMKFKLLETQVMTPAAWRIWCDNTSYLRTIHSRFFGSWGFAQLAEDVLDDLVHSGAAGRTANRIWNA